MVIILFDLRFYVFYWVKNDKNCVNGQIAAVITKKKLWDCKKFVMLKKKCS